MSLDREICKWGDLKTDFPLEAAVAEVERNNPFAFYVPH